MKFSIGLGVAILVMGISQSSMAAGGQCANYAKSAAIGAYMRSVPSVDRNNLSYQAQLKKISGAQETYVVSVASPCVVEGDDSNCSLDFQVVISSEAGRCSVISTKELK